jgi:hypothetical protein
MTGTGWENDDRDQQWPAQPDGSLGPPAEFLPEHGARHAAVQPRRRRGFIAACFSAAAVVIIAAVVFVVTSSSSGQTPAQALAAAVSHSVADNTINAEISEQISGSTAASITGTVQARRKPLLISMKMSEKILGTTVPISGIITTRVIYLKLGLSSGLPQAAIGKWIELKLDRTGPLSSLASELSSLEDINPVSEVQALAAAKDVRKEGTQMVGGVLATKYTGSFSPSAALKLVPGSDRSALAPAMKLITGNVVFSIWVNGNHIIKVTEVEHVKSSTATVTVRYRSYNRPVTIKIPPASQVFDASNISSAS